MARQAKKTKNTNKQIIPPSPRPIVVMRAGNRHVTLPINRIVVPQRSKALENAVALARVARRHVQHHVHEPVRRVAHIADNERARVQALPQPRARLRQVRVAGELDLDHGTCDIRLADADSKIHT